MKLSKKQIWTVVILIGTYLVCQAVADVGATKLVQLGSIVIPAGTFIFTLTFTLRDLIHKRLGKEWARAAIVVAGALNIFQAAYLAGMSHLPAPGFFPFTEAWTGIFALVPSITLASIVAEVISELVDTEIYHLWWKKLSTWPQWTRVLASNAVSLPLDSLIFGVLAFTVLPRVLGGDSVPFTVALSIVGGQIIWKAAVTVISMPAIYLVRSEETE